MRSMLLLGGEAGGDHSAGVTVSDQQIPPLQGRRQFVIDLTKPFALEGWTDLGAVRLSFPAIFGQIYSVGWCDYFAVAI